jgi:hypothetical protein
MDPSGLRERYLFCSGATATKLRSESRNKGNQTHTMEKRHFLFGRMPISPFFCNQSHYHHPSRLASLPSPTRPSHSSSRKKSVIGRPEEIKPHNSLGSKRSVNPIFHQKYFNTMRTVLIFAFLQLLSSVIGELKCC